MAKNKSPKDTAQANDSPAALATLSGAGRGNFKIPAHAFGMMSISEEGMASLLSRLEIIKSVDMASFEMPKELNLSYSKKNGTALIKIDGPLFPRSSWITAWLEIPTYEAIEEAISAALADDEVERIVLDANSPGGAVQGCFGCSEFVAEACETKPIITHTSTMACSGMYMIAAACDEIHATPASLLASIGAHKMHVDRSKMLDERGYKITHVVSGIEKYIGHGDSPLSDEDKAAMQREVDSTAVMFMERVAKWRGVKVEDLEALNARVVKAEEALGMGLVDSIASLKNVLEKGAEMPKVKPAQADGATMTPAPVAITDSLETVSGAYPVAVKAIQDAAIVVERERSNAITTQTMAGFEELSNKAKSEGWDELRFLKAQTAASQNDSSQHMQTLADTEAQVPKSVPAKPQHVAAISLEKNASTDSIKAVYGSDKAVRNEFSSLETFTASVKLEGYKKEGVK